jgi:signal transduction histidine kinase
MRGGPGRLLTPAQARRAARGATITVPRRVLPSGEVRVRGGPITGGAAAAVGEPLLRPDLELDRLQALLLVVGPLALALVSFAGYEVAGAALRPVDELLAALEATVARERRLVSDASHELRTPLTVLRTELQLALRGTRTVEELRAALHGALGETDRLSRLANDLLVLARVDEGALPLRLEPLDVRELLEARAARLRAAAEGTGRDVTVDVDGVPVVLADPDRAAQAVDNLAANALQHGGGAIALQARGANAVVELHVLDEGSGFGSPEAAGRAFERFSGQGTGLGLAIVDAIARAHGGSAGAQDRPEGGGDAWIALPAA